MSSEHEKGRMDCLFSRQDMNVKNVKFFRGDRDLISQEEFRAQISSIEDQKRSGSITRSTKAPRSEQSPIDVRAFVANM